MRYVKRIKLGPPRAHVERKFNVRDRPTVHRLSDGQVEQVDKALRSGRIEATAWTDVPEAVSVSVGRRGVASRVAERLRKALQRVRD